MAARWKLRLIIVDDAMLYFQFGKGSMFQWLFGSESSSRCEFSESSGRGLQIDSENMRRSDPFQRWCFSGIEKIFLISRSACCP